MINLLASIKSRLSGRRIMFLEILMFVLIVLIFIILLLLAFNI